MKEFIDYILKKEKKPVDLEKIYEKIEVLKQMEDSDYTISTDDMKEINSILTKGLEKYEYYRTPNGRFTPLFKTSFRKGRFHGNRIGEGFVVSNISYTNKHGKE